MKPVPDQIYADQMICCGGTKQGASEGQQQKQQQTYSNSIFVEVSLVVIIQCRTLDMLLCRCLCQNVNSEDAVNTEINK